MASSAGGCGRALVHLPPLAAPVNELWHVLLDLAGASSMAPPLWTLVGGQMVLLHAVEHGQVPPQISQDGDVVADVRAAPGAVGRVVDTLEKAGFSVDGMSPDMIAHRLVRPAVPRPVSIDVLAPEGVGPRAQLFTRRPGRTVEVPGGTQALQRTEFVDVHHEGRIGSIPRPSLLGAIVGKSAACSLPGDNSRHLRDLALLCALVPDPFSMLESLTKKDSTRLRHAGVLGNRGHPAWVLLPATLRARGQDAYLLLTAS